MGVGCFSVNDVDLDNTAAPYKSYFSLKDFNKIMPEKVVDFMKYLQDNNYNGHIKLFQDLVSQGVLLNDQFVMHGLSEADAKLGEALAKEYFKKKLKVRDLGKMASTMVKANRILKYFLIKYQMILIVLYKAIP